MQSSLFEVMSPDVIAKAYERLRPHLHRTPVVESALLNNWLGHRVLFKAECLQKVGAFKYRGAMNTLLSLQEQGRLPRAVVSVSSGNHAQAVAKAAQSFGIPATIYTPSYTSAVKIQATRAYGAQVILTADRNEAERRAVEHAAGGIEMIPPYDRDEVIAGQGTACFEALQDYAPDAVFATCSGGGLLSGTWLAAQASRPGTLVFGTEPLLANDAAQSLRENAVVRFADTPPTIADGAAALSISARTLHYLKQLNGFYEVSEEAILYWTQWLTHLLKLTVEPTSAVAMAGAAQWLATQTKPQTVLVILSGGNIAPDKHTMIWKENRLTLLPCDYDCS